MLATVKIGDHVCNENEVNAISEGLTLLLGVCQGQLSDVGQQLVNDFLARKDVTDDFRIRLERVQELFNQAHKVLHDDKTEKGLLRYFSLIEDAVPLVGVRAHKLLCRLNNDKEGLVKAENALTNQAEMCDSE